MDIGRIENHQGTAGCKTWRLSADVFLQVHQELFALVPSLHRHSADMADSL